MKKAITTLLVIGLLLSSLSISVVYADTPATISPTVGNIQSANPTERGFVGNIIAAIFDASGRIRNNFIIAFQSIEGNFANTLPRWDGMKFVGGSLTDNGNGDVQINLPAILNANNIITAGYIQNLINPGGNIYRCPYIDTSGSDGTCGTTCTGQLSSSSFCTDYVQYRAGTRDRRCRPVATHECTLVSGVQPAPPPPIIPDCDPGQVPVLVDGSYVCQAETDDGDNTGKFTDGDNPSDAVYSGSGKRFVGINTTTPEVRLHVNGSMRVNNISSQNNTSVKGIFGGISSENGANILLYGSEHTNHPNTISLNSSQTPRLIIHGTTGNVGIGTTPNATDKLRVDGNISATDPTADNHVATKGYVDSVNNNDTIISGWPNYIICSPNSNNDKYKLSIWRQIGNIVVYHDEYSHGGLDKRLNFNLDSKNYHSQSNLLNFDCINKSISQLEFEGKTRAKIGYNGSAYGGGFSGTQYINRTSVRTCGTTYTNNTDGYIFWVVNATGHGTGISVNIGNTSNIIASSGYSGHTNQTFSMIIPPTLTYSLNCGGLSTIHSWYEL